MNEKHFVKPLLSIVIPTRNRFHYVKSAIKSILSINNRNIELIVQDNSDTKDLSDWVFNQVCDERLIYHYADAPLSFVGNFDQAVSLANGTYVCLIGDDDGINHELPDVVQWMHENDLDSLSTVISANYVWPNSGVPPTKFTKVTDAVLTISNFSLELRKTDLERQLKLFFSNGCIDYLSYGLPKLYSGVVKRECLLKVKQITGNYFGGLSPDIYASISLSFVAKKVYVTDYPLIISGVCGQSASIIEGLLKSNSKDLLTAPHFRNRGHYEWSNIVPAVYTVETIWADSSIAAIKDFDSLNYLNYFNVSKLAAHCVFHNKGITRQVVSSLYKSYVDLGRNVTLGFLTFLFYLLILKINLFPLFIKRIFKRLLIVFGQKKITRFENVIDIEQASAVLSEFLELNKKTFFKSKLN